AEASELTVPRTIVQPLRAGSATASEPIRPPTPGRFSMTTGWPRPSENFWTTTRATLSLDPPGGNGTTKRIGRLGYGSPDLAEGACACSPSAHVIPAMHAVKRHRPMI